MIGRTGQTAGVRRDPRWTAVLAVAVWGFVACGDRAADAPAAGDAPGAVGTGGTAVIGVPAGATTLYPPLAAAALDFELGTALFLGLNFAEWGDGELEYVEGHPLSLTRGWEIDGRRLTYRLDPGRTWSDGRPIGSGDVAFTFALLMDTTLALPLSSITERLDSLTTPDDSTVVLHFDEAYPGMLFDTGIGILPAHALSDVPRSAWTGGMPGFDPARPDALPVSGPFRLSSWSNDRIVLVRNEAAPTPARLDRVVVDVIPDETTRARALSTGEIQAAPFNSYPAAASVSGDVVRYRIPQRGYDYIAWNPSAHPAFLDRDVRQALSLAIDRDALIGALGLEGFAQPAWGPYGSLFPALEGRPPHRPLFDPARSRALLDAAGWRDADGDGVREREGEPLDFELRVPAGNERRQDAAEIILGQLADVGVGATVRPEEFNALLNRVIGGRYEAALMGWQVALDPDISAFWQDPGHPLNVVAFSDPAVRAAMDSALAAPDADAARRFWARAGQGVADAYPYAFLWYFDLPFLASADLEGVAVDVTGWGGGLAEWRLAAP